MAFILKQGDRRPSFVVALKDDFGEETEAAVDLTTAGTAYFNMRAANGGAVKISRGTATITSAATGVVTYAWGATDTDTAGDYEAELEILWNDGKAETFPNDTYWDVEIVDDVA
jgi:hypothetical protein